MALSGTLAANVTISKAEGEREKGRIGAHGARGRESPGLAHFSLGWKERERGRGREENDTGHYIEALLL